jgi:dimethylargininase
VTRTIAITRDVSPAIIRCELTHLSRVEVDLDRARRQHEAYRATLTQLGCEVECLMAERALPDSVFVEDTAVVLDELAVVARPGAESRRGETASIAAMLRDFREVVVSIEPPETLDGGDVLVLGREVFVGLSSRTSVSAVRQLATIVEPHGYRVSGVEISGCLHLKSAACAVAPDTVLVQRRWVDPRVFGNRRVLAVDDGEPFAANALLVHDTVIYPEEFPRTRAVLEDGGIRVLTVAVDELAKAEGRVTCCSLLVSLRMDPSRE